MLNYVPISLLYAIPVIPIFIIGKLQQNRYSKIVSENCHVDTNQYADAVARRVLKENQMDDIAVERSDDYSVNRYDPEVKKVLLSPETMGQKDISSVGIALYAVGAIVWDRVDPAWAALKRQTTVLEPVTFWTVFTILAFGLMAGSLPVVIFGYALSLLTFGLRLFNVHMNEKAGQFALEQANRMNLFNQNEYVHLKEVISAIARQS